MKKAQGISINTIIIAAIALIVLIILIAVFTGRMGWWGKDMDTAQKGLKCPEAGVKVSMCPEGKDQILGSYVPCTSKITDPARAPEGCLYPGEVCCET